MTLHACTAGKSDFNVMSDVSFISACVKCHRSYWQRCMSTCLINVAELLGRQIASQTAASSASPAAAAVSMQSASEWRVDGPSIHRSLVSTRDEWNSHISRVSGPTTHCSPACRPASLLSDTSIHHIYCGDRGLKARHAVWPQCSQPSRFRKSNHFIMRDDGYLVRTQQQQQRHHAVVEGQRDREPRWRERCKPEVGESSIDMRLVGAERAADAAWCSRCRSLTARYHDDETRRDDCSALCVDARVCLHRRPPQSLICIWFHR